MNAMHVPSIVKATSALAFLLSLASGEGLVPYKDGQCKEIVPSVTISGNKYAPTDAFADLNGFPKASFFSDIEFDGVESKDGGYDIWWQVPELNPGCGVALMQEFSQISYGNFEFEQPPGNVFLFAKQSGCIYSHIQAGVEVEGAFCCGLGDCGGLSAGNAAFGKRSLAEAVEAFEKREAEASIWETEQADESIESKKKGKHSTPKTNGQPVESIAGRVRLTKRDEKPDFDGADCKHEILSPDGHPSAGKQQLVANRQTCSSGEGVSCSFIVRNGVTIGSSLSTNDEYSVTNTLGASISVKAGINFLVNLETTATFEASVAETVSHSTGTTLTNTKTVEVSNQLGQHKGTSAFVTFTPTYNCWTVKTTCGGPGEAYWNFCQPAMTPDGNSVQGDYTVVYTS